MKILLVEDEPKIANLVKMALESDKHLVQIIDDGLEAKETVESEDFDLAVIDLMLPGANGFEVCRHIRSLGLKFPVLMLTARDSVEDKVAGLDSGADDYLTKPFELEELFARIRALSRREKKVFLDKVAFREMELDPAAREIRVKGRRLRLAPKEFQFLEYLLRHPNETISRTAIAEHLWNNEYLYTPQQNDMVNVLVSRIRKKVSDVTGGETYLQTVSKQGYKLA